MKNISSIKQWFLTNWAIVVLVIVSFLYFKSCQGGNELKVANQGLKKSVALSEFQAKNYLNNNKALKAKIDSLERIKQRAKTEIVYIAAKTEGNIKKVSSLTTKGIASYYQERYKLPVTVTPSGVIFTDTIGKLNISELIRKDGCFAERKFIYKALEAEEQKGVAKDSIIKNFSKAITEQQNAIEDQKQIIKNVENSFKKERTQKTFWKVTTVAVVAAAGYLLIAR